MKIHKKIWGRGGGQVRVDVKEEIKFCENAKKKLGERGGLYRVRVDVNEDLKLLWNFKKKLGGGGGGGGGLGLGFWADVNKRLKN